MATELAGQYRRKAFLIDGQFSKQGADIRLKGGVTTDFPTTGDKIMPPGAVVVLKTSDGLYYLANDTSNGDRNTAAAISSLEKPDADWKSKTITWAVSYPDGSVFSGTVAAGTGDDTVAEFVTLLNSDEDFAAHLVASDAGATDLLTITTLAKGRVGLSLSCDLSTVYGDGVTLTDYGAEADYRVISEQRDLTAIGGATRDSDTVPTFLAGHFDESELTGLTPEARGVLISRGSIFG